MQSNTADVYVRARRAGGFREKLCLVPFLGVFKGMPGLTVTRAIALNFALLEPRTSRSNRIRLLWEDSSSMYVFGIKLNTVQKLSDMQKILFFQFSFIYT